MLVFLSILASGACIGYLLRHKNRIQKLPYAIQVVVCTLLFLLGLSVGVNKDIVNNLTYYCEQAVVISFLSILGSLVAAALLYKFCFKEKENHEG